MPIPTFNYTTGPATLSDDPQAPKNLTGTLSYNGCTFSPLYETTVAGIVVQDGSKRTTKVMEYTIVADGYVTLPDGALSTTSVMDTLRRLLTAHAGTLIYRGRGCDIIVNAPNGTSWDVEWGPVPKLLDFQPLGGGRSAKVKWQVKVAITEIVANKEAQKLGSNLLQFVYDTSVSYGEDGYSSIGMNGMLEIPMTRPTQASRALTYTADNYRSEIENRLMNGIDLSRFVVTRRNFNLSKDKRILEWNIQAEEKSYMDLPMGCTKATGNYQVRPAHAGMGLVLWHCTLQATYTVARPYPRRYAWYAFLALLRYRMNQSQSKRIQGGATQRPYLDDPPLAGSSKTVYLFLLDRLAQMSLDTNLVFLIDFNFDEGLYTNSKTISFSATWQLAAEFATILSKSGLWIKLPEEDTKHNNLWAKSMGDLPIGNIQKSQSWLTNTVDPALAVIVDFGGK